MDESQPPPSIHNFIDRHLREIKWISFGLGGIAVITIFRSIRMTKKFTHASQIPARFLEKAGSLRGTVRHVTDQGHLHIEHIPIWESKVISRMARNKTDGCLSVKPAGIVMSGDGVEWLRGSTVGKHAWFQMLHRDHDTLHCDIKIKTGRFFGSSICSELVKRGLGKLEDFDQPPEGDAFHNYLVDLVAKEHEASRKDKGLWKEVPERRPTLLNNLTKTSSNVWSKMRKLFNSRFGGDGS